MRRRGRMYESARIATSWTVQKDVWEVLVPSDMCVAIHTVTLTQQTEIGDAEDQSISLLFHLATGAGSGGNSVTPTPLNLGTAAATTTTDAFASTQAAEGTHLHAAAFNLRYGWEYRPTPMERIVLSPSDRMVIRAQGTIGDSITFRSSIVFEEIGG